MATAGSKLDRLTQLLATRGFVARMSNDVDKKGLYRFGPAGVLLKQNIYNSWWHWMVSTQESSFPVEETRVLCVNKTHCPKTLWVYLSQSFSFFLEVSELNNKRLPFSMIHVSKLPAATQPSDERLLFDSCSTMQMTLLHACTPSSSSRAFDHWMRYRLSWWKKFAVNPSHFTMEREVNGTDSGSKILYKFPWGQETIETIINKGDNPFKAGNQDQGKEYQFKFERKLVLPHLIECSTTLETSMMAILTDAHTEKGVNGKKESPVQRMIQLHPALAPYKIATATSGSKTRELLEVATHIAKELRTEGVQVLHTQEVKPLEKQYTRNDELGIPFTVIVNDATLDSGLVGVRERDTAVKGITVLTVTVYSMLYTTSLYNIV
ncbi:hypothetical protein ACJMK2_034471 [Sinanodonta woodiana]|uniref:Anticodon-binding domain-containing protein n=1 Tax=Sinanodonta woodiana TaxID=1069815 RepID=A0ABD3WRR1_SINWO